MAIGEGATGGVQGTMHQHKARRKTHFPFGIYVFDLPQGIICLWLVGYALLCFFVGVFFCIFSKGRKSPGSLPCLQVDHIPTSPM